MDLFECLGRYLGQRPRHGPPGSFKWLLAGAIVVWSCLVLVVIAAPEPQATASINNQHSWPTLKFNQTTQLVDNLLVDDKDESVFIASRSGIYKYSSKLEQLLTSTDASASTSGKVNGNELFQSNITNKLLFIVRRNNPNLLLSCWLAGAQQQQLLKCWINKLNDLRLGTVLALVKDYKLSADDRLIGGSAGDRADFIIASSLSFQPNQPESPYRSTDLSAVGRFELLKSANQDGAKYLTLNQKSALNFQPYSSTSNIHYEYIYIFNSHNHTYFILNELKQQQQPSTTEPLTTANTDYYTVRIARICNNDTDLSSYVEIAVTCNDKLENLRAKAAFIEPSKKDLLTISFEELDESKSSSTPTGKRHKHNSLLCFYSMKWADDLFSKAVSECNNGFQSANLLIKFHPYLNPPPCQKNPSLNHDWCTSKTNLYIDGTQRYNLKEDHYVNMQNFKSINFLYMTLQGPKQKEVTYIGTEYGLLTKMVQEDPLYTIDFNTFQVKSHLLGEKFKPLDEVFNLNDITSSSRAKYTVHSEAIYVVSPKGDSVSRLQVDSCSYYSTCKSCLLVLDPLECIWCGDSCTRKQECDNHNQTNLSCPPVVKQFHPKIGPLTGMTQLKIEGENLGSSKGLLAVRLNEQDCLVDKTVSTSEFIECIVQPVREPINATLSIDVLDESHSIDSKGSYVAKQSYSYVRTLLHGLSPTYTTTKNGTILKLVGENLHAGSRRQVFLNEIECNIIEYNMSIIKCLLAMQQSREDQIFQPKLMIDGVVQPFELKPYHNDETLVPNLTLTLESHTQTSTVISNLEQGGGGFSLLEPLVGILLLVLVAIVIVSRFRDISTWSSKLSKRYIPTFCYSEDKKDHPKVSFRDIQSRNLSQTNFNTGGESTNGLIKLNGSIMSSDYFGKQEILEHDQLLLNNFVDNETLSLLMQQKILIDRGRLTLGHVLGSGQFGRVYKGFLKVERTGEHAAVAVKTLHSRSTWDDAMDNRAFLEEGLMMKDFEHENVLALIGVTFDSNGLPMVITPFMLYGDLRSYISDETSSPTVKELIDFGTQVARGMAYLSSLKFVHRDLAARNCMLDENLVVKVADFGLSRDIYERDYYSSDNKKAKLPVKWMAIESLEKSIYNTKTDVWSYGVLLWELMTRGVVPYPDIDNFDLFSYLKEGRRMLRPRYCPVILYKIMLECWDENPQRRPTFNELDEKVSAVITNLKIAKDGQQTVDRDETYCDVLK